MNWPCVIWWMMHFDKTTTAWLPSLPSTTMHFSIVGDLAVGWPPTRVELFHFSEDCQTKPQTLLNILDLITIQNMMGLCSGSLERRSRKVLLGQYRFPLREASSEEFAVVYARCWKADAKCAILPIKSGIIHFRMMWEMLRFVTLNWIGGHIWSHIWRIWKVPVVGGCEWRCQNRI